MLALASALAIALAGATAASLRASSHAAEAALDKRLAAFSRLMRCLVCQNETLADSQAELAVDLRREIRAQMQSGRSDDEITRFLTDRYGDFVRYQPPLTLRTYPLWFGPFILLAGALAAFYRSVRNRGRRHHRAGPRHGDVLHRARASAAHLRSRSAR
jgi:cytochrome c-type biogenesis protein CcmH